MELLVTQSTCGAKLRMSATTRTSFLGLFNKLLGDVEKRFARGGGGGASPLKEGRGGGLGNGLG